MKVTIKDIYYEMVGEKDQDVAISLFSGWYWWVDTARRLAVHIS